MPPDGTTVSNLARRMNVARRSAHQTVHALLGMGLLEQIPNPASARGRIIVMTAEGRRVHRLARTVAAMFKGWAPELVALVADSDIPPIFRPLYGLPIGHRWDHIPGVTLIGDAAHLAPPDGEGANWALFDAGRLGNAIAEQPENIDAAIRAYETALFPRNIDTATAAAAYYPEFTPH